MRLMKPGVSLYAHQKLGRRFILRRKYVLLGDEMGLGKSLQAIAAMVETENLIKNSYEAAVQALGTTGTFDFLGVTHRL